MQSRSKWCLRSTGTCLWSARLRSWAENSLENDEQEKRVTHRLSLCRKNLGDFTEKLQTGSSKIILIPFPVLFSFRTRLLLLLYYTTTTNTMTELSQAKATCQQIFQATEAGLNISLYSLVKNQLRECHVSVFRLRTT